MSEAMTIAMQCDHGADMFDTCWPCTMKIVAISDEAESRAAYEQRMTDARILFDLALSDSHSRHALLYVFHEIAGDDAERKT